MRKTTLLHGLFGLLNKQVTTYLQNEPALAQKLYDRRKFLKESSLGIGGVTLALTLPSLLTSCKKSIVENPPTPRNTHSEILELAILGAGMAGLNCANHLLASGIKFKIFEGSKRLGGRILTHYNDSMQMGIFSEFGGDFIDSEHEDMLGLAKEFNLELLDLIEEQQKNHWIKDIYFFDHRKLSEHEIIQEFKKIVPQIVKDKISLGEKYDTAEAKRLDLLPLSEYLNGLACTPWLKELLDAAFIAEYGLDCKEQSTLNMLDLIETNTDDGFKVFGNSDERYRIKGGNSKIIEHLAQKIGEDKIEKNYQVHSITETEEGSYLIQFDNGKEIQAKAVVCTIPFTILRNLKLSLKNMSPQKRKCIDELGYGKNTKLVLGYEGQPWRSKENKAMGYLFTKDMTNGWDASINKTENNPNGAFVVYFGGEFSQKLCDQSSKNPFAPPSHVWRTELPKPVVQGFVNDLDKIFTHSKEKFKEKHVFVNWLEYPWIKASYTCYLPGQWTTISGLEIEPVGNFFFAGEHCSQLFQGFMNGAAETGRRVAELVLKKIEVEASH